MFARGSGTDGEVGKTGVRRVQRELSRGPIGTVAGFDLIETKVVVPKLVETKSVSMVV